MIYLGMGIHQTMDVYWATLFGRSDETNWLQRDDYDENEK